MHYYIYKITNIKTGTFYIGSHKTVNINDGYFGSGVFLKRAIKKYGKESFIKEILKECKSLDEMKLAENDELQKIKNDDVYNLKFCSMGGNTREKYTKEEKKAYIQSLISNPNSPIGKKGKDNVMFGKKHTADYKQMRKLQQTQYYIDLKKNDPDAYKQWYDGVVKTAVKNCLANAAKRCKKIIGYDKTTGKTLYFKSVTCCLKELKIGRYRLQLIIDGKDNQSKYLLRFNKYYV